MTTPRRPPARTQADPRRDPGRAPDWRGRGEPDGRSRGAGDPGDDGGTDGWRRSPDWRDRDEGDWMESGWRQPRSHRAPPQLTGLGWAGPQGDDAITTELARVELSRAETAPFAVVTDAYADTLLPEGPTAEEAAAAASGSVLRSSGTMAIATIASRGTGFLRTLILLYALGLYNVANAYNLANTLPNAVYNLALGGILTSVVVPLIVNAATRDADRGESYDQRIFTLGVLALAAITIVATVVAHPIAYVYAHDAKGAGTYHLTILFAYFFIPQIFFYGVSSLAGAILNARGRFGAPMWTPVINNMVVIVVGGAYLAIAGRHVSPTSITPHEIALLGFGTTLGIVLQTLALIPSLLRVGFRWRPRFDFRRAEVAEVGRMGGWMFGYVVTTQVSFAVTAFVANQGGGTAFASYSNAWQLFQLPYAVVGISVITAMLPRMSAHASRGRYRLVAEDFSGAVRLASVVVVPAALVLAVLGPSLGIAVSDYGANSAQSARDLGVVFAMFSLGLLPYMLFQLLLRVFYALHDSRTPALIGVGTMVVNVAASEIDLHVLPARLVVAGLGVAFGLANLTGTIVCWYVLSARLRSLDGRRIGRALVRMHVAAVPAAIFALAAAVMIGVVIPAGRLNALVTVALAGAGALLFYVLFGRALALTELTELTSTVRARLRH